MSRTEEQRILHPLSSFRMQQPCHHLEEARYENHLRRRGCQTVLPLRAEHCIVPQHCHSHGQPHSHHFVEAEYTWPGKLWRNLSGQDCPSSSKRMSKCSPQATAPPSLRRSTVLHPHRPGVCLPRVQGRDSASCVTIFSPNAKARPWLQRSSVCHAETWI